MSEQEKSFKEWIADLERRRIRAVQMVLDGAKQKEVAKQFKVTTGAVCQWMMAYREKGWEGLEPIPRRGGPIIFTDEHKEKLLHRSDKLTHFCLDKLNRWFTAQSTNM